MFDYLYVNEDKKVEEERLAKLLEEKEAKARKLKRK